MDVLNTKRQNKVLQLLRDNRARWLYEAAGPDGRSGSGVWWVTRTPDAVYEPLQRSDVDALEARGQIRASGPGSYVLAP